MYHALFRALMLIGIMLLATIPASSGAHQKSPFALKEYRITTIDSAARRAKIDFVAEMRGSGQVDMRLVVPTGSSASGDGNHLISDHANYSRDVIAGDRISGTWDVVIPAEGYHEVAEVRLGFHADNARDVAALTPDDAFSLYAEIAHGSIRGFSMAPDPLFTRPATDISKPTFTRSPGRRLTSSTTINISISGRIQYEATNSPPGGPPILNGVPNVRVGFDWNRDNNFSTIEMPGYDGGADPYTYTDANGDYTFTRHVTVDNGATIWSTQDIRVFVRMSNDAGYNEDYGLDAIFPENGHAAISISPSSPNISATGINTNVNVETGAALRYMWRAREFAINDLGLFINVPPPIRFDIDHDDIDHFNPGLGFLITPSITFTGITNSEVAYHEYGHYATTTGQEFPDRTAPTHIT